MFVKDFEVINDTVYFCGTENGVGIIGYFAIATLTSSNPEYYLFYRSDISIFKKLDVFYTSDVLHVVMLAEDNTKNQYIFDVKRLSSSNWVFTCTSEPWDYCIYEDIVATHDYVMVSRVNQKVKQNHLLRFKKPLLASGTIFGAQVVRNSIPKKVLSPYWLEQCGDRLNTVAVTGQIAEDNTIACVWYTGNTMLINSAIKIPMVNSTEEISDIEYNRTSGEMNILTKVHLTSYIYHFTDTPGSIYYHWFYGNILMSFDYLEQQPTCFIATGRDTYYNTLKYFRFVYTGNNQCMPKLETYSYPVEYEDDIFLMELDHMRENDEPQLIQADFKQVFYERECTSREEEEENDNN